MIEASDLDTPGKSREILVPPLIYFESLKKCINPNFISEVDVVPPYQYKENPEDPHQHPRMRGWRISITMSNGNNYIIRDEEAQAFAEFILPIKRFVVEQNKSRVKEIDLPV